jgi:hypothetical protein
MSDLGVYPNKYFSYDIKIFEDKLKKKETFTFSKFADGEWAAMQSQRLNNNEFQFVNSQEHNAARELLIDAFRFQHKNYYVGVSCPCCQGNAFEHMKEYSGQPLERLTWANLWVNSNYDFYLHNIVPLFNDYKIALVAHSQSNIDNLSFRDSIKIFCPIEKDAWVVSRDKIDAMKKAIDDNDMKGWLVLFCAGPFGNILAHQLTEHCDKNTYLDVGSTLNPFLGTEGFRRSYFNNHGTMKPCIWR